MGKVYKAHDALMDREVAIKVLSEDLAAEPGYHQRFRREAQITARLTEPHIIRIFEAGEIEGRLYLVMPVIEGIDVQDRRNRAAAVPEMAALAVRTPGRRTTTMKTAATSFSPA